MRLKKWDLMQKKLESKKKRLKTLQRKHNHQWFREEGDLIHDIQLLGDIKVKMEKLQGELKLLITKQS